MNRKKNIIKNLNGTFKDQKAILCIYALLPRKRFKKYVLMKIPLGNCINQKKELLWPPNGKFG